MQLEDALDDCIKKVDRLIAERNELLDCLSEAVGRMLGTSSAISKLRERSLNAIAKVTGGQNAA